MRKLITLGALSLILGACTTTTGGQSAVNDTRPCMQNFSDSGNFVTGKSYRTFETIQGVNQSTALNRASRQLVASGLHIAGTDRQAGVITASNQVIAGGGSTVPLTVVITPVSGGVKVENTFTIAGGLVSQVSAIKRVFCEINTAIKG